ncbi:MAG: hypothetical protein AB4426_04610 [Xenococcaceae cyanobacterium]
MPILATTRCELSWASTFSNEAEIVAFTKTHSSSLTGFFTGRANQDKDYGESGFTAMVSC